MLLRIFMISSIVLLLSRCDCSRRASGVVCDRATHLPLTSVTIKDAAGFHPGAITESDATGSYEYGDISGGLFRCPPLRLAFMHQDYQTYQLKTANCGVQDTVFLSRAPLHVD